MSGSFLQSLLLRLMNMSIAAGVLILLVMLLRLIPVRVPKWIRLILWGFVALRLVVPFSIQSVFSLIPSTETIPRDIMFQSEPHIISGIPLLNQTVNPVIEEAFAPEPTASVNPLQIVFFILTVVWLLGILLFLLYFVISQLRLGRKLQTAVRMEEGVYESDRIDSPFVFGYLRPRIYMPFGLPDKYRESILLHEQEHIRHKDPYLKALAFVLLSLYWFHPLVWAAYFLFVRDLEICCDERVLRNRGTVFSANYSEALLSCSIPEKLLVRTPVCFGETAVKQRIKAALSFKKPAVWAILASVLVLGVIAVCFLTDPKSKDSEPVCRMDWDEFTNEEMAAFTEKGPHDAFRSFRLKSFRNTEFCINSGAVWAVCEGEEIVLCSGIPIENVYTADVNHDGVPEVCITASFGFGLINEFVSVIDLKNDKSWLLFDRKTSNYYLYMKEGKLFIQESPLSMNISPKEETNNSAVIRKELTLSNWDFQPGSFVFSDNAAE